MRWDLQKVFVNFFFDSKKKVVFSGFFFQIQKQQQKFSSIVFLHKKFFAQSFLFLIKAKTESCYFFFELLTGRLLKKKMRSTWKLVDSWKMLVLRALLFLVLFVLPEVPEFIKFKNSWNTKNHWGKVGLLFQHVAFVGCSVSNVRKNSLLISRIQCVKIFFFEYETRCSVVLEFHVA